MTPKLETTGLTLICIAIFISVFPFTMSGKGVTFDAQQYREAKGSRLPAGFANSQATLFLSSAAVIAIVGFGLVISSRVLERRRIKKVMPQRKGQN